MKQKKKLVLSERRLRKIIRERIFVGLIKEAVQKFLIETVDFAALKKELESAYDHFKAENPDLAAKPFDWGKITSAFMKDPEAKQMLKIGDADGLVNKMLELFAENPLSGQDVEKHAEKAISGIQKDDVDDAFEKIQKKKAG